MGGKGTAGVKVRAPPAPPAPKPSATLAATLIRRSKRRLRWRINTGKRVGLYKLLWPLAREKNEYQISGVCGFLSSKPGRGTNVKGNQVTQRERERVSCCPLLRSFPLLPFCLPNGRLSHRTGFKISLFVLSREDEQNVFSLNANLQAGTSCFRFGVCLFLTGVSLQPFRTRNLRHVTGLLDSESRGLGRAGVCEALSPFCFLPARAALPVILS